MTGSLSSTSTEEESSNQSYALHLGKVIKEATEWRTWFSWGSFLQHLVLGLIPSIWDVWSDYKYIENWKTDFEGLEDSELWNRNVFEFLSYAFIALPHSCLL